MGVRKLCMAGYDLPIGPAHPYFGLLTRISAFSEATMILQTLSSRLISPSSLLKEIM